MTGSAVPSDYELAGAAASGAATLVELKVTLANQTAELSRLREAVAGLVSIPAQLESAHRLWQVELTNVRENLDRGQSDLRRDIETIVAWQTWAVRIVLGAVILAVLGLVVVSP